MDPHLSDFYRDPWTREVEFQVLRSLHNEFLHSRWIVGDPANNHRVLEEIRRQLMQKRGSDFDIPLSSYTSKLKEWETRFIVFQILKTHPTVWYDEQANRVHANWEIFYIVMPNLLWYRDEGESNFGFMKDLFPRPVDFWQGWHGPARPR